MNNFSEDQMYRPLFEEPTHEIERGDAWEGPPSFLIGGMANRSLQQLAEEYFDAAFLLTEIIQKQEREDYRLASPILFLYCHSIELLLKATMKETTKTQSLDELIDDFVAFAKREFGRDVPSWIPARIKELAKIATEDLSADDELHVDLLHLQRVMNTLKITLDGFLNAHKKP